jgi:hypothetical protein
MKKTMLAFFGVALLVAVPSCKKGANDPALSLKSRKSRLAGEYTVTKHEKTTYSTWSSNPTTVNYTYDGGEVATETTTSGGTSTTVTTPVSLFEFTFDKKGTWEMRYNYETKYSYTSGISDFVETTNHTTVNSGTWAFIGKTKDNYKNKERVQLSILTDVDDWKRETVTTTTVLGSTTSTTSNTSGKSSNTYSALEYVMTYAIDMLKNKEMTFTYQEDNSYTSTDNSGTSTTNVYTQEETLTLTQK